MHVKDHTDDLGRMYKAFVDNNDHVVIIGPPEGFLDDLGMPEAAATRLHNILFRRGLINFDAVSRDPDALRASIQEFYNFDVQKLHEAFFLYENGG